MIRIALPLLAFSTIACAPIRAQTLPAPTPCGSHKVIQFVGKTPAEILPDEIARRSGAKAMRLISPGEAVTMDYREDRLNVYIDDKGVITRITCG